MQKSIQFLLVLSTFFPLNVLIGQSGLSGLTQSNYSIVENVALNPAASADPKAYFVCHIFGVENMVSSNYLKFNPKNFGFLNGHLPNLSSIDAKSSQLKLKTESRISGPGFNYSIENFSIGFNMSIREFSNLENLDPVFTEGYFQNNNVVTTNQTKQNMKFDKFRWEEIGIHAGTFLYKKNFNIITTGLNLKFIRPTSFNSVRINSINYSTTSNNQLNIHSINGNTHNSLSKSRSGWGMGFDIGFQFKKMKKGITNYIPHSIRSGCKKVPYKYKLGFSLLDIGLINYNNKVESISFDANDVMVGNFSGVSENNIQNYSMTLLNSLRENSDTLSNNFMGMLPTSMSFQYDQSMGKNAFFNISTLYGFDRDSNLGAERISWIAASYRYEKSRYELSTTTSYNSLDELALGAAVRFLFFSIGTNNIVPFLQDKAYAASFYFHAKFIIPNSKKCAHENDPPIWRFSDCTGPRRDSQGRKKGKNARRNKRRAKKYR